MMIPLWGLEMDISQVRVPPLVQLDSIYDRWTRLLKETKDSTTLSELTELQSELKELVTDYPEVVTYPKCYLITSRTPEQALILCGKPKVVVG